VADDAACIDAIKEYLSYFPASNLERPPVVASDDPANRMEEALLSIVPDSARRAYDMKKVIAAIVDRGHFFEIKPAWAKNLITCLARMGGRPVGMVANQPMVLGGALDVDSADKAARFIMLCDAFHIPLVFLQDVPGFMVGSQVEKQGIIRHGAKMLYAVSEATVPKVTVVIRKAYGAGYFVMCGKAYEPDLIVVLAHGRDLRHGARGRHQYHLPQGDRGRRQSRRGARAAGRGVSQAHQPIYRSGRRVHR
jgi:acetyl-CoA carboxylase carboxyltransferase component